MRVPLLCARTPKWGRGTAQLIDPKPRGPTAFCLCTRSGPWGDASPSRWECTFVVEDLLRALRWRLDKACGRIEQKRAAAAKRASRAEATVGGPRLFALAPSCHLLTESDVQSDSKVVVLATTLQQHPCRALSALSRPVHDAVAAVLAMHVENTQSESEWIDESSLTGPGPIAKPVCRALRALGGGLVLVALGAESSFLLTKVLQDESVARGFPLLVLVQPQLACLKPGALSALARLQTPVMLVFSRAAQNEAGGLLAALPLAKIKVCNDGPGACQVDHAQVGQCIRDEIMVRFYSCQPTAEGSADSGDTAASASEAAARAADGGNGDGIGGGEELEALSSYEVLMRPGASDSGARMSVLMIDEDDGEGTGDEDAEAGADRDAREELDLHESAVDAEESVGHPGVLEDGLTGLTLQLSAHDAGAGACEDSSLDHLSVGHAQNCMGSSSNSLPVVQHAAGAGGHAGEAARRRAGPEDRAHGEEQQVAAAASKSQKWVPNYPAGAEKAERTPAKKQNSEGKAIALSRARARERMRGERIGR